MNKATSKRRLLILADFLEKLPRKRFDLSSWVGNEWEGKADLSCGTSACAMGWATTIPQFRKLGLRLSKYGLPYFGKGYYQTSGMHAAADLFGISDNEAYYLFMPYEEDIAANATPKQVAKHIRKFVAAELS